MNFSSYCAVAGASIAAGYWLGKAIHNGDRNKSRPPAQTAKSEHRQNNDSDSDEDAAEQNGDPSQVAFSAQDECKMTLVVRTDLGMSVGKVAAQCSHAALACYKTLAISNPSLLRHWERSGQTKIALRCSGEAELLTLQAQAQALNLCARSIQDAGRTQVAPGSRTVLGIGPGPARLVNQVTGLLKAL